VTIIAAHGEAALDSRLKPIDICLGQGYFVPVKQILAKMKPMVFANYHPAIMRIVPHTSLLWAITLTGWENQ
jgi:hypothetical protein